MTKLRTFVMMKDDGIEGSDVYTYTLLQAESLDALAEQINPEACADARPYVGKCAGNPENHLIQAAIDGYDGAVQVYEIVMKPDYSFELKFV